MVQASAREIKTYTTHYRLPGFNLTRLYSTEDSHLWIEKQYPLLIKLESHALAMLPNVNGGAMWRGCMLVQTDAVDQAS